MGCSGDHRRLGGPVRPDPPPPAVVVTDGGSGIRSALANTWPDTLIQRCIFHLQLNVTRELTRNPRLRAGRALRQIALNLTTIHDIDAAIAWRLALEAWWQRFGHLTRERTLYDNGQFGYTTSNFDAPGASCTGPPKPATSSPTSTTATPAPPHAWKASTAKSGTCSDTTAACPSTTAAEQWNGSCSSTRSPSNTPTSTRTSHNQHHQPGPTRNRSAQPSTTPASTPKKASGHDQAGPATADTPKPSTLFGL